MGKGRGNQQCHSSRFWEWGLLFANPHHITLQLEVLKKEVEGIEKLTPSSRPLRKAILARVFLYHSRIPDLEESESHMGLKPKVISLRSFLDKVPSSLEDVTRTMLGQPKHLAIT